MTQQNWRTETNATDYLTNQKKQLVVADRRPVIRRASDLVGPGIASGAIRITDFADPLALFNGFFSALHTALDRPPVEQSYVGYVSSDLELGGVQMFFGLSDGLCYTRVFNRGMFDPDDITWSAWTVVN